jgi:hypothetical protein
LIPLAAILYMLPSVVASLRGHHRTAQVLAINILLGWTVVGWLYSLERATSPIRMGADDRYVGLVFLLLLPILLFFLEPMPPRAVVFAPTTIAAVPEPSTSLLMVMSLVPLGRYVRRRL